MKERIEREALSGDASAAREMLRLARRENNVDGQVDAALAILLETKEHKERVEMVELMTKLGNYDLVLGYIQDEIDEIEDALKCDECTFGIWGCGDDECNNGFKQTDETRSLGNLIAHINQKNTTNLVLFLRALRLWFPIGWEWYVEKKMPHVADKLREFNWYFEVIPEGFDYPYEFFQIPECFCHTKGLCSNCIVTECDHCKGGPCEKTPDIDDFWGNQTGYHRNCIAYHQITRLRHMDEWEYDYNMCNCCSNSIRCVRCAVPPKRRKWHWQYWPRGRTY